MIPVTKPYLPSRDKLNQYIDGIYERNWLTNNGPLVQELTHRLEEYLGVENLLLVSNGTLALQVAYHALGINAPVNGKPAEAITTPFTFIATASSLKWDGIAPVFADIDPATWCLAPENIEAAITPNTRAVVPVHVFGNACDVEAIDAIAQKHSLKVIYDAAHAFGVKYKGESLLKHGDAATLSFHATKLFHTGEGGAIVFKHKEDLERAKKMINFGITGPETIDELGINAKMNELQAAMGLCVLDEIETIIEARSSVYERYSEAVNGRALLQKRSDDASNNYAYFPVVLPDEETVLRVIKKLNNVSIFPRRYFYPSLDQVQLFENGGEDLPVSKAIAKRVLCFPLYSGLDPEIVISELSEVTEQPRVENISTLANETLIRFLEEMDAHFVPPIAERVSLLSYVVKLKAQAHILGVLDSEGLPIAAIAFYANDRSTHTAYVTYLAVHPTARGKNLGKVLIAKAFKHAAINGMDSCSVSTWADNSAAIKLYQNAGFEVIEEKKSDARTTVYLEAML